MYFTICDSESPQKNGTGSASPVLAKSGVLPGLVPDQVMRQAIWPIGAAQSAYRRGPHVSCSVVSTLW